MRGSGRAVHWGLVGFAVITLVGVFVLHWVNHERVKRIMVEIEAEATKRERPRQSAEVLHRLDEDTECVFRSFRRKKETAEEFGTRHAADYAKFKEGFKDD